MQVEVDFQLKKSATPRGGVVLDAVEGLGEALVSGAASPDHEEYLRSEARFGHRLRMFENVSFKLHLI